ARARRGRGDDPRSVSQVRRRRAAGELRLRRRRPRRADRNRRRHRRGPRRRRRPPPPDRVPEERLTMSSMRASVAVLSGAAVAVCAGGLASAAAMPTGTEFHVNTYTTSHQGDASIAISAGRFVIVWSSYQQDGSGNGVFARLYSNGGGPVTGEIRVNTYT